MEVDERAFPESNWVWVEANFFYTISSKVVFILQYQKTTTITVCFYCVSGREVSFLPSKMLKTRVYDLLCTKTASIMDNYSLSLAVRGARRPDYDFNLLIKFR